jgi:hypothetical protein
VKKALRILGFAGLAVGVLAYPAAFAMDRVAGQDVILVSPRDEAQIAIERFNWESEGSPKAPVHIAEIYGNPFEKGRPMRLVAPRAEALFHPPEAPEVTLFFKKDSENPFQAMTLWYFAFPATIGGLVAGALLLWLSCRKKAEPAA